MSAILSLFAWMPLVAVTTAAVLLVALRWSGDVEGRSFVVLLAWFAVAAGLQFIVRSPALALTGMLLQTVLAVYLLLRWRISAP